MTSTSPSEQRVAAPTEHAPAPAGPYSQAISRRGVIATAGQIGVDPVTGQLAGPDIASQTRQAVANTVAVLAAARATLGDVIQLRVFLCDLADFGEMNRVVAELFPEPFPARTTVGVGLPKDVRVEIDTLAVVGQCD